MDWSRLIVVCAVIVGAVDPREARGHADGEARARAGRGDPVPGPPPQHHGVIIFVGVLTALLLIPQVRAVAGGLLASTAILGIVIGLAAQRTLSNFVAA